MKLRQTERFLFAGVPDGTFAILGQSGTATKRRVTNAMTVTVAAEGPPAEVELRLQPVTRVRGRVTSLRGAVAGALVSVQSEATRFYTRVTTDLEGAFETEVPEAARGVTLTVMAPGHALRAFEAPVDGSDLVLHVPSDGGTVRLLGMDTPNASLQQDGKRLWGGDLLSWSRSHGGAVVPGAALELPAVSPGLYRACAGSRCVEQTLAPGAAIELDFR
ncbi:MAG TPA: carboxypeptidase-like regulatory domain-containing protein [Thermoanaerobaculia bacterium]